MKILIVHQNFVDHKHPGGTRHLDIAKCLVAKGHEVTIVASTVDYLSGQAIEGPKVEVHDGVRIVRAYALPSVQRSILWRVISYLSFVPSSAWVAFRHGRVDVVLGTTPPIFQLPATWLVAKLRWAPFVLEVLDLWPEFAIGMGVIKNRFVIWLARKVEWFFNRAGKQLIVNSPAYRDYMIKGGIPEDRVTFIPMGVDLRLFDTASKGEQIRERFRIPPQKFVVTYAGAHGISNDLDTVLGAAERLQTKTDIHFLFVGGGNDRPRLEEKAKTLGLKNVTFGGTVPKEEMGDVLAASSACIALLKDIPQYRTPFPNKVFDYMAAGRPVLLGIDGVIREVMEKADSGIFFPPGNASKLAEAIVQLHASPELVQRYAANGRDYVEKHYDIRLQADRFAEVFEKATSKS